VFTTDSRDLGSEAAARLIRGLVSELRDSGALENARIVYKKVDSTLRGHPGEELAALMDEAGLKRGLIAPAFPAQGRTTVEGRQFVDGVRLDRSSFGREARTSDLKHAFDPAGRDLVPVGLDQIRASLGRLDSVFSRSLPGLVIGDAETDADLIRLARAALAADIRLFCGSAGLMSALMEVGSWKSRVVLPERPARVGGPVLIVSGTRHQNTAAQIRFVQEHGAFVLSVHGPEESAPAVENPVERACRALAAGEDVVLAGGGSPGERENSLDVALLLADLTRKIILEVPPGALALTGGDTAGAVCRSCGVSAIQILGEVVPGIPQGRLVGGLCPGLPVATKAGGFGGSDALELVRRFLHSGARRGRLRPDDPE
jgi:uncharacterized protein YgbK (DUF1537 family)